MKHRILRYGLIAATAGLALVALLLYVTPASSYELLGTNWVGWCIAAFCLWLSYAFVRKEAGGLRLTLATLATVLLCTSVVVTTAIAFLLPAWSESSMARSSLAVSSGAVLVSIWSAVAVLLASVAVAIGRWVRPKNG
jgi:hypothetical protein